MAVASYYGTLIWIFFYHLLKTTTQKHPKRMKENLELGELRQETDTKQCSVFSSDCSLITQTGPCKKKLEQKKLSARMSLRTWNKTAILQWSQVLSQPSEVGKVKGQYTGENICRLHNTLNNRVNVKKRSLFIWLTIESS